jgi:hypothetical protein
LASSGDVLYVAGVEYKGGSNQPPNLTAIRLPDHTILSDWSAGDLFATSGTEVAVNALVVSADGTVVYLGGEFGFSSYDTSGNLVSSEMYDVLAVGGLAHKTFPGQRLAGWRLNGTSQCTVVNSLFLDGTRLYVGNANAPHCLAVNISDAPPYGTVDANWHPDVRGDVQVVAQSTDGTKLYVGGRFTNFGGNNGPSYFAIVNKN